MFPNKGSPSWIKKSSKFIFIGYNSKSKAYKLFDPYIPKVAVSKDMAFDEHGAWDSHNKIEEI